MQRLNLAAVHIYFRSNSSFCEIPVSKKHHYSPVENQNDLELDFKVVFFVDSCCWGIVLDESN